MTDQTAPATAATVPAANARRACIYAYLAGMTFGVAVMALTWWLS